MITLVKGNIAEQEVTFIVNAANEELLWEDKTVNGMIHLGGGPELTKACGDWVKKNGKVETSHFAVTLGFNLPCNHVIHTVGPVYPCNRNAKCELENTYEYFLSWAALMYDSPWHLDKPSTEPLPSIAIPAISTGVFRYPFADATKIQMRIAKQYVSHFSEIRLVYYTDQDLFVARSIYEDYI